MTLKWSQTFTSSITCYYHACVKNAPPGSSIVDLYGKSSSEPYYVFTLGPISTCSTSLPPRLSSLRAPLEELWGAQYRVQTFLNQLKSCDYCYFHAHCSTLTRSMAVTRETHDFNWHLGRYAQRRYLHRDIIEQGSNFRISDNMPLSCMCKKRSSKKLVYCTLRKYQNLTTVHTKILVFSN